MDSDAPDKTLPLGPMTAGIEKLKVQEPISEATLAEAANVNICVDKENGTREANLGAKKETPKDMTGEDSIENHDAQSSEMAAILLKRNNFEEIRDVLHTMWTQIEKIHETGENTSADHSGSLDTDLTVHSSDKSIDVHSVVLAAASPVLREIFSGICECKLNGQKLKLESYSSTQVLQLIKLFYTGSCNMDENHLAEFEQLLAQFKVENIEKKITAGYPRINKVVSLANENINTKVEKSDTVLNPDVSQAEVMTEEDRQETPPNKVSQETAPMEDSQVTSPTNVSQETAPMEDSQVTSPTKDSQETAPMEDSQETAPMEDSQETPPMEDSQETPPMEDSQETPPMEDSQETAPKEDTQNNSPSKDSQETPPTKDSQETPPTKDDDIYGTPRPSTSLGHYAEDSEKHYKMSPRPSTSMGFRSPDHEQHGGPVFKPVQGLLPRASSFSLGHASSMQQDVPSPQLNLGAPLASSALHYPYPSGSQLYAPQPMYPGGYPPIQSPSHSYSDLIQAELYYRQHYYANYQMMTQMTASTAFNPQVYYNQHLNFQQQPTDLTPRGTGFMGAGNEGPSNQENANDNDSESNRTLDVTGVSGDFDNQNNSTCQLLDVESAVKAYSCTECEETFQVKEDIENHYLIAHQGQSSASQEQAEQEQAAVSNTQKFTGIKRPRDECAIEENKKAKQQQYPTPSNFENMKLECCGRKLDIKSYMLHCVRIHVKQEMQTAVNKVYKGMFSEKQGQCPKCPKKLLDTLSFADHMAVEHRQVIDLIINKPRFAPYKDVLKKLKDEVDDVNTSSSDVEVLETASTQGKRCPLCNREEHNNSLLLRHIVDAHYYFQLRKMLEDDYAKKKFCDCDLDMGTLRFFIRHQAIKHQLLLKVCTSSVAKLITNAKFKRCRGPQQATPKLTMKATTSTPKRGSKENVKEGDTLKRRNEVWISNANLNSSPRPKRLSAGKTLKDQNRKIDGPRTPTKKGGNCVETAGTRTVGRPRSDRIRIRDQNTDPKQEEKTGVLPLVKSNDPPVNTPIITESLAPKSRYDKLAEISTDKEEETNSNKKVSGNRFLCFLCKSVKVGYKVMLSHLSSGHYRDQIRQEFGQEPHPLQTCTCPFPECGLTIYGRNYFFHLGSKHEAVLKYATWFNPPPLTKVGRWYRPEGEDTGVSETEDPLKVASATDEETEENFEDTVVDSGCIEDKNVDPDFNIGDY